MTAPVRPVDPITATSKAIGPLLAPYFDPKKWGAVEPIALPLTHETFKRICTTTPKLYLGFESIANEKAATRQFAGPLTFRLLVVVKNPVTRGAGFYGDAGGPGLYPSLIGAVAALHGRTIGDGSIEVKSTNQVTAEGWADLNALVGYVDFSLHVSLDDILGESAAADDFRRLVSAFEVNVADDPEADPSFEMAGDITLPGDAP